MRIAAVVDSGLYVHVPFCVRKCVYCDFYSVETTSRSGVPTGKAADQGLYLQALEAEFRRFSTDFALEKRRGQSPDPQSPPASGAFSPTTIFIGGGTPTELSDEHLRRLFELIHLYVPTADVAEWTCEVNPGTLTVAKANILRRHGVNRISLGAQSFDVRNLQFLGRIHSPGDIDAAFHLLRDTDFTNINLDLIYGIPDSPRDCLSLDLDRILDLDPEHISCYCLTFEEGTPLMGMKQRGQVRAVADEDELEQYQMIRDTLRAAGYEQYEISNFAKPGRRCAHNRLYWIGGEYIGCGPAAHSHWRGNRMANHRRLQPWSQALLAGDRPVQFEERLEPEAKAREILVSWLRLIEGVPKKEFLSVTGYDWLDLAGTQIKELQDLGMLVLKKDTLRLSEAGLFVSDRVFAELI